MEFDLSQEQEILIAEVQRFCRKEYGTSYAAVGGGKRDLDKNRWKQLGDNGWIAAVLGEGARSTVGTITDTSLILIELGRVLAPLPYCECAVMPLVMLGDAIPSPARDRMIDDVCGGNLVVAVACKHWESEGDRRLPDDIQLDGNDVEGLRLSGQRSGIIAEGVVDVFLVSVVDRERPGQVRTFVVPRVAPGVSLNSQALVDGSQICELQLDRVRVNRTEEINYSGNGFRALEKCMHVGTIGVCAEAIGAMEAVVERTCGHLKARRQFGVALSSYQVLQHRISDMAIETELARSMLYCALASLEEKDIATREAMLASAKVQVGVSGAFVGAHGLQLHGALGMSEEYPIGRFFKRLKVIDLLFGTAEFHLSRLAEGVCGADPGNLDERAT